LSVNNFEKYLNSVDKRQKYLIYVMVFGLIIYLSINLMMPLWDKQNSIQENISSLQTKLAQNSLGRLQKQLSAAKQEVLTLNTQKDKQKEKIDFLISGLYKLKYAFYDDKEWAKSIRDILHNSLKRDLKINYIKSMDAKNPSTKDILKRKRTLEIVGSGNYRDVVAFISYIDNLNTLLQFTKTDIFLKEGIVNFKLNIDLYGIGL
jgi:signal transduction protein with GAF and PtsI domain